MNKKPKTNVLKAYRVLIGINQTEAAQRAGIGRSTVSRIESGKRRMTEDERQKLAGALNCSQEVLR